MWYFFKDNKFPEAGRKITIIWNDGTETDHMWGAFSKENIDWTMEECLPVLWKYL